MSLYLDPIVLTPENVDDIWACDWEDSQCPICGRPQDAHTNQQLTSCAIKGL